MSKLKKVVIPVFLLLVLAFSLQASALDILPLKLIRQAERTIYGQELESPSLVERIEMLEKSLYGGKQEGSLQERAKKILDFVLGTEEKPSLILTLNTLEWTVSNKIRQGETLERIKSLEKIIFGEAKAGPIVNRVKEMQDLSLPEGKLPFDRIRVPEGVKINIELLEEINSEAVKVGQKFKYIVSEDITYDGNLLIPVNTTGWLEITKVKRVGQFGRDGSVEFKFLDLRAIDGTYIAVKLGHKFKNNTYSREIAVGVSLLGTVLLENPIGLAAGYFVKGKEVVLPIGYEMELTTAKPVTISSLKL